MLKPQAWVIAGAAVLATAGIAHAQENVPSEREAVRAEVPWYQQFTTSSSLTDAITGETDANNLVAPAWTLNQRWGVTVDIREGQRIDRTLEGARQDETSVGAYYQFTPRVRLGGEVSVGAAQRTQTPSVGPQDEEPSAGVRLESAFRF